MCGRTHVAVEEEGTGLFALLDGHGGEACALLLKRALEERFGLIAENRGLEEIFASVDAAIRASMPRSSLSGASCVLALADAKGNLALGHVGDSRAVLCDSNTGAVVGGGCLISSHLPEREDEAVRILAAGQEILRIGGVARINGGLALSRCFGAFDYKACGAVTAAPESVHLEWPASCILVLYCSSVVEGAYTDEEVAETAAAAWRAARDAATSASAVCTRAIQRGARRSVACLVLARRA